MDNKNITIFIIFITCLLIGFYVSIRLLLLTNKCSTKIKILDQIISIISILILIIFTVIMINIKIKEQKLKKKIENFDNYIDETKNKNLFAQDLNIPSYEDDSYEVKTDSYGPARPITLE